MRSTLLAATALAMLCGPVFAQTSQSNSGSNATVNTASGSQSQSVSNPRVSVIGNPIGNGTSSSDSGARATSNNRSASRSAAVGNTTNVTVSGYAGIDNSGSSTRSGATGGGTTRSGGTGSSSGTGSAGDPSTGTTGGGYLDYGGSYTIRNTPEVIAPSVVGGNPCSVGASGGISLPGFGVALGGTWADKACERRQQAALLFNMGENKVAVELMCQDDNVRTAMKAGGKPCTADIQPVASAPAVGPTTMAASLPASPAEIVLAAAHSATAPRPDWCSKAAPTTEASKAYVAQVCGN
jgi:hypothetical protein